MSLEEIKKIEEENCKEEVVIITTESSSESQGNYIGSLGTDEDEDDDLLKDPPSNWDIFDDYHKFVQMD